MGRQPKKLELACATCGERKSLDKYAAARAGWELWLGGGRCPGCSGRAAPPPAAPEPLACTEHVIVGCQGCGREMEASNEYTDGWRPGIHWTNDEALLQQARDSRAARVRDPKAPLLKVPLCPGWDKPGRVLRVERREVRGPA